MIYTLIMTLWLSGGGYTPIITVSEHSSEQACRYAGAQQEIALRNDFKHNLAKHYTFICVPK